MVVGVPGAGIGGLFYLLCALWAPARELWRVVVLRRPARMPRLVARQAVIAVGILGGIWFAGWAIAVFALAPSLPEVTDRVSGAGAQVLARSDGGLFAFRRLTQNVVTTRMFLAGFATLSVVLLSVQMLRVVIRFQRAPARPAIDESSPPVNRSLGARAVK